MPVDDPAVTRELTQSKEVVFRRFRLRVLSTGGAAAAADRGREAVSDGAELVVGTLSGCDLVLADPTASRHHLRVTASGRAFVVEDLGSTNGTTVNGVAVERAFLRSGATLGAGETLIRFEVLGDEVHEPLSPENHFGGALGRSPALRRIFAVVPRIAASTSTVLIEGETGTGKTLLAEAIHRESPRRNGPFVVLDCGAIPPGLIESELFGHERGAFTGAVAERAGAFEAAGGGTILIDEIGELPLAMQPKLLRALEDRVVKRVGATATTRVDVRVIAATNRALHEEVNRGAFRPDLYYRLNTVRLRVPPLRERREDIPLLVAHFYRQFSPDDPVPPPELVAALETRPWPGNVRELRSAVERAVLLSDPFWDPDEAAAPEAADRATSFRAAKERMIARWEKSYLADLVTSHTGNLSAAARAARMDRNHLRELLKKHGIQAREE
jgi:DNA-binding NtrC family response regulator